MPFGAGYRIEIVTLFYLFVAIVAQLLRMRSKSLLMSEQHLGALYMLYAITFFQSLIVILTHMLGEILRGG